MKVVIDIPEDDYKLACNYPDALIACYAHYIKAGVPLPKKHGRLIDADALNIGEYEREDDDSRTLEISIGGLLSLYHKVIDAPTVIEAEESGDE